MPEDAPARLQAIGATVTHEDGRLVALCPDENVVNQAVDLVRSGSGRIVSVTPLKRSLEEIFVETIGLEGGPSRRIGTMNQLTKDSDS